MNILFPISYILFCIAFVMLIFGIKIEKDKLYEVPKGYKVFALPENYSFRILETMYVDNQNNKSFKIKTIRIVESGDSDIKLPNINLTGGFKID